MKKAQSIGVSATPGPVVFFRSRSFVQAMLALGIGVRPAGALLLTLPPISLPSLVMVAPSFRARVLVVVTTAIVGFGVTGGLLAVRLHL